MNTSQSSQEVFQPSQGARSIFNLIVWGSTHPAELPGGAAAGAAQLQWSISSTVPERAQEWDWCLVLTNPRLCVPGSILLCLP